MSESSSTTIIDDFEDGNLSEYSINQSEGEWPQVTASPDVAPPSGSNVLEVVSGNELMSTSGLERYPAQGDTFEFWAHFNGVEFGQERDMGILFGIQDNIERHYRAYIKKGDGNPQITKETESGRTVLDKVSADIPVDQWVKGIVNWKEGGEIVFLITDGNGTEYAKLSTTDTSFTTGGIGWEARDNGIDPTYFDAAKIVTESSSSDGDQDATPGDDQQDSTSGDNGQRGRTKQSGLEIGLEIPPNICVTNSFDQQICLKPSTPCEIGTKDCNDLPGGETPLLFSCKQTYLEKSVDISFDGIDTSVTYKQEFYIGVELDGQPCIWVGDETAGVCTKVPGSCDALAEAVEAGEMTREGAENLAEDVWEALQDLDEIRFPSAVQTSKQIIIGLIVIILLIIFTIITGGPINS